MRPIAVKSMLAASTLGALLAGCATTMDMGPGYYHYDTRAVAAPSPTPTVVYQEPAVVYREPAVVYRESTVVGDPAIVYRTPRVASPFNDHGQ